MVKLSSKITLLLIVLAVIVISATVIFFLFQPREETPSSPQLSPKPPSECKPIAGEEIGPVEGD
ncbi:MAG: hypothetical protein DRJ38_06915, partial [Thermoprotei archaeon]